jgi:aryl-alcohol dehydrogenase-like predicted oxidoreductase
MQYRTLGSTGVKVSPLCLGCMNFGSRTEETESVRIIHEALDAGINFVDTANVYGRGASETILGKALKGRRDQVVIATKFVGSVGPGPNDRGASRSHAVQQVEASLMRLDTDRIDLYQLHLPDPETPIEETLAALTDLIRQGKVRYIGTSNFAAWQICEALWMGERCNLARPVCEQPGYNILWRSNERELLPFCTKYGVAVIPLHPLASGWLSGKYRKGREAPPDSRGIAQKWDFASPRSQQRLEAIERLIALAEELGLTLSQMSLAWLLAKPSVTSPIIGPRTLEQYRDNVAALDVVLEEGILQKVDEIVPPGTNLWP